MLGRQFGNAGLALPPLEVGITAQRPDPRTRRIDQHPVELACQSLDLDVVLALDAHRVHVGQARTRKAGLKLGQSFLGNVESIQAPLRAHHRPKEEGLATGTGTEIRNHFAPFGLHE